MPVLTTGATETLQDAAAADGNGAAAALAGYNAALLVVAGTFSATVSFEGSIDEATYFAVGLTPADGGAVETSTTAAGYWALPTTLLALSSLRAVVSGYASGTVTVTLRKDHY